MRLEHWIYTLPLRLRSLFHRPQVDRDLDDEIRDHLERRTADYIARGLSPEEARYAARREFGGIDQVKEECRDRWGVGLITELVQDLRYGLRQLRRSRGFTAVAVITLALGIGANTAIFSLIDKLMLRSLPVEKPEQLVGLSLYSPVWGGEPDPFFSNALWEQVRDQQDVFSGVLAWGYAPFFDLTQGGIVENAHGIFVSGGYFSTLGVRAAAGRLFGPSDDQRGCPSVAVLSYSFWQRRYGGAKSAIGRTTSLDRHPFQVIGASAAGFYGANVEREFDVAVPICAITIFHPEEKPLDSWWWLQIIGRVKPGVSAEQMKAHLSVLSIPITAAALPPNLDSKGRQEFLRQSLVTFPAATGISFLRGQFKKPLEVLMAMVGLVLLIACANIASLMLARATSRNREIAVRRALGASRWRLIRQLLTESVMLSSTGALMGLLFARWGSALLVRYISTARYRLSMGLPLDGRVLAFTAAVAVLTGLLAGTLPAFRSTRGTLTSAMKGRGYIESRGRLRSGRWIVASQVALSLVLLVTAGLFLRSFAKLARLDVGFDRHNVLLVSANLKAANVPPQRRPAMYEEIASRLRALPGVVSASRSVKTPLDGYMWSQAVRADSPNPPTGKALVAFLNSVAPSYFETLRTPILAGRDFNYHDTKAAPSVAIVSETLVNKLFPGLDPIGRYFRTVEVAGSLSRPIQIVGVVKDSKYEPVGSETYPTAFVPITQQVPGQDDAEYFEVRTATPPSSLTAAVQKAVADVNKAISIDFHTLADRVSDSLAQERLLALLSGFFGGLALLLAMIGLYGTLSYVVTERQTEFGVRMALGAQPGSILRLVMRDVILVLAAGLTAGIGISLAVVHLLQNLLFGLAARDTVTMAAAAVALSVAAFIAAYLPARRATRVDPVVTLRYE
jgi:predicted permease